MKSLPSAVCQLYHDERKRSKPELTDDSTFLRFVSFHLIVLLEVLPGQNLYVTVRAVRYSVNPERVDVSCHEE